MRPGPATWQLYPPVLTRGSEVEAQDACTGSSVRQTCGPDVASKNVGDIRARSVGVGGF